MTPLPGPPAGFWRRALAYSLDWMLMAPLLALLLVPIWRRISVQMGDLLALLQDGLLATLSPGEALASPLALMQQLLADPAFLVKAQHAVTNLTLAMTEATLFVALLAGIYFIACEALLGATPGKKLVRLEVVAVDGSRVGWGRAAARHVAGVLSWLSLNLGHALAGWRQDGRALHDLVAGTAVLATGPPPRWVGVALLAQAVVLLALFVALLARLLWLQAAIW